MKSLAISALLLAACRPLPPVPTLPVHASTEGAGEGETTAIIVLGFAGSPLGGGGWGGALRIEHQYTDATTLGVELTGGAAAQKVKNEHDDYFRQWLLGARGYGRSRIGGSRYADYTYGVGLAVMGSGSLVTEVHAGGLVGYPNDYVEPQLQASVALSVPVLSGTNYGGESQHRPGMPYDVFFVLDGGAIVHPRDSNSISLDVGVADPMINDDLILGVTAADAFNAN
ncbi:MAG TPA: hypothetical protein VGM39_19090 [Kofleriaceae bacterium]